MRAPMAFVALALMAGILLEWGLHPPLAVLSAVFLAVIAGWACSRRSGGWANLCLLILLIGVGMCRAALDGREPRLEDTASPVPVALEGTLVSDPALGRNGRVATAWFQAKSPRWLIQVQLPSQAGRFEYGERLRLYGRLRPGRTADPNPVPRTKTAAGTRYRFDERQWLWVHGAEGVLVVSHTEEITRLGTEAGFWMRYRRWVSRLKRALAQQGRTRLSSADAGMLEALLLGEGRGIPPETWEMFRKIGTVHVLVVSGLHVGLIGLISLTALALMGTPRVPRYLLLSGILLTYCLLTGSHPPIVRATAAGLLICWGKIRGLEISPLNLLGIAAAGLLAFQPRVLADAGFQLSFSAVAGLLLADSLRSVPSSQQAMGTWYRVKQAMAASCWAWAATAPLVAWHFHTFSLITPLANLLVVPGASLLIAAGFLMCGAGLLAPWATAPFAAAFSLMAHGLTAAAGWLAGLPGIFLSWNL